MYKKHCNRCYRSSYSSCKIGEWLCPTCNSDLTKMKAIIASNKPELSFFNNNQMHYDFKEMSRSKVSYKI